MVRNIDEIKKLIDQGKEDEITKEEIEMLVKVIETIVHALTPLTDMLEHMFGEFLNIVEDIASNLD